MNSYLGDGIHSQGGKRTLITPMYFLSAKHRVRPFQICDLHRNILSLFSRKKINFTKPPERAIKSFIIIGGLSKKYTFSQNRDRPTKPQRPSSNPTASELPGISKDTAGQRCRNIGEAGLR